MTAMSRPRDAAFDACFSADVEQDCPPYLDTCRGMAEGMPRLLDLLDEVRVQGTFFVTGEMARRFPEIMQRLVRAGHELASHGDQHLDFTILSPEAAEKDLVDSLRTLRQFAPVTSFRAPYLRFPYAYLPLLVAHGLHVDSSVARYKRGANHEPERTVSGLTRIAASATSSVLRLPAWLRSPWLGSLQRPLVIFVHPWEAVDFRRSSLRWDCRFRTGEVAVELWRTALEELKSSGARFRLIRDLAPEATRVTEGADVPQATARTA
jgi:peptidoglycan/xylan/chitin deacetylase (PgdA/CDA1 family)